MPAFALVIGLFATTVVLLMQAFVFDVTERIGLFASIVAAIAIDLAHVVRRPSRTFGRVFVDTLVICLTFGLALIALGSLREIAAGTLPLVATAPAAFLIAGLSIAAKSALARTA